MDQKSKLISRYLKQKLYYYFQGHKSFSAIISALEGKAIVQGGNSALQSGNTANRFDQYEKYPLSVLRGPKEHLPPDVDPLIKEVNLLQYFLRCRGNMIVEI